MSNTFTQSAIDTVSANPELTTRNIDTMQAILRRSATDSAFRASLLTDSRAALSQFAGREMPVALNVKFIEKQGHATYVLPAAINSAAELSETELEMVAGGSPFLIPIAIASSVECAVSVAAISCAVSEWLVQG